MAIHKGPECGLGQEGHSRWLPHLPDFPLDAVPDFIPGGGLLDDVAVILFVAQMLAESLKAYAADAKAEVEVNTPSTM